MIKLVIALGNPGDEYKNTRHNLGRMALDFLSFSSSLRWEKKFKGIYSSYVINEQKCHFLMPETFMNLSGQSAQPCLQFFKIVPEEMIVLHDELDLPFGEIALKKGGGLAGHNGLRSLAETLGTQDFYRMRLGISRPTRGTVSDWVLEEFSKTEKKQLSPFLQAAADATEMVLKTDFQKASSTYSKKNFAN